MQERLGRMMKRSVAKLQILTGTAFATDSPLYGRYGSMYGRVSSPYGVIDRIDKDLVDQTPSKVLAGLALVINEMLRHQYIGMLMPGVARPRNEAEEKERIAREEQEAIDKAIFYVGPKQPEAKAAYQAKLTELLAECARRHR